MNFTIRPVEKTDRPWVLEIIRGWSADFIVSRGRKIFAAKLPAFVAESPSASDSWAADVPVCPSSDSDNPGGLEASPPLYLVLWV